MKQAGLGGVQNHFVVGARGQGLLLQPPWISSVRKLEPPAEGSCVGSSPWLLPAQAL